MLDDLRDHDANPSDEERRWMDVDPLAALSRVLALAIVAVAVGVAAGYLAAPPSASMAAVAAAHAP